MPSLDLRASIAAPVDQVYAVVADVERYPEFLADVAAAEKCGDVVAMTLRMGWMPIRLVTRVRFDPPHAIELALVDGPFARFAARWTFAPDPAGTEVGYRADYELPVMGSLLCGVAGAMLERQTQRQIAAFRARVGALAELRRSRPSCCGAP
jgi:coenzyme Q-binding protein COQ10